MKRTNAYQYFKSKLNYKRIKPPTCTCFGQAGDHPQGGLYKGYITKTLRINANFKYKVLKCAV